METGQQKGLEGPELTNSAAGSEGEGGGRLEACSLRIKGLRGRPVQGALGVVLFVLLSLLALRVEALFPVIPAGLRRLLGASPSTDLINIALVVYSFSALILILSRMMGGDLRYRGWVHLGYMGGFFLFYLYAGALKENFWAIFAAGITIFALEYFNLWTACQEEIRREEKVLRFLSAQEKPGEGD
ncbi:hypothetical protein DSOUD_1259 [Desulfuromonas soudanensis]|uniref:Menaquinol oxidoreductase n=1 Tax=Desulfuromonas soudanensis TaxID=1603606 RepID=A0A0M4CZQ0_9BACT|nr:menaquinol oxidoreductase [Desulfuromonas soudanensis]ALC16040.1 hypothetical protein DSOUD_1259 [Desulfuromonas soudanensis]